MTTAACSPSSRTCRDEESRAGSDDAAASVRAVTDGPDGDQHRDGHRDQHRDQHRDGRRGGRGDEVLRQREPIDPDIGRRVPGVVGGQGPVVAAVAVGGAVGALARYSAGVAWPTLAGGFPWTTLTVNVVGCALLGALLVLVTDLWNAHRLVRPLVGTGVLGGFTTFSTWSVDVRRLIADGHPALGLADLAGTLVLALAAVTLAVRGTRRFVVSRRGRAEPAA